MKRSAYSHYDAQSLILRDHLAIERTTMANERTLLAYVRTMTGIMAVGGTLLKLFVGWFYALAGWSLIVFGLAILIIGFTRYARAQLLLASITDSEADFDRSDWMHHLLWSVLAKLHLAKLKSN